jgi:hypothetical protein
MHGYANADGAVTNWRQYYVRCQFEEPAEARRANNCFVVALGKQSNGSWRVAFEPTYRSLFASLYGSTGEPYLYDTLHQVIGERVALLWSARRAAPFRLGDSRTLPQTRAER